MSGLHATMNYLVPASGTTSGFDITQVFSATPVVTDWRTIGLDGKPFVPSGVFIDNTQGTGNLTVRIVENNYSIICPPGVAMQTQYPAPLGQSTEVTGQGQATVVFVDFPVIPFITPTIGGAGPVTGVTIADGADVTQGAMADLVATTDTGAWTLMSLFKRLLTKTAALGTALMATSTPVTLATDDTQIGAKVTAVPALGAGGSGIIGWLSDIANQIATRIYPRGAISLAATTTGAAAPLTATLVAAATGTTAFCTGLEITGGGATAASVIAITLTGGTAVQNYRIAVPAGVTLGITPLQVKFDPPFQASAVNTNIVLSAPSLGAGNTDTALNIRGFRL